MKPTRHVCFWRDHLRCSRRVVPRRRCRRVDRPRSRGSCPAGSALWLLAIAFVIWGAVLRPRLEARIDPMTRPRIDPLPGLVAARVAVMAMAACRVCAAVAGVYSGIAIATVAGGLATPAASQAFWASVLAASGSGVASAASLRLERSCLLPSGADNDDG